MSLKRILKSTHLVAEDTDKGSVQVFEERTHGMWDAAWESVGKDVRRVHDAARIFGISCYLQGVRDAATAVQETVNDWPEDDPRCLR